MSSLARERERAADPPQANVQLLTWAWSDKERHGRDAESATR